METAGDVGMGFSWEKQCRRTDIELRTMDSEDDVEWSSNREREGGQRKMNTARADWLFSIGVVWVEKGGRGS